MLARLAALALVLSAPALAQEAGRPGAGPEAARPDYNRPGIVRGLCQKDGCDEFSLVSLDKVRTTPEGTLFRTRVKTFHASSGGRRETGEENGHVYCSTTRPALMADQNGRTTAFHLAPFAAQESREAVRKNANFHALYFSICHGPEAGNAAVRDLAGTARSFGYQVPLAQSRFVTLNRAEDILGAAPAAAASPAPAPQAERRASPGPSSQAAAPSPAPVERRPSPPFLETAERPERAQRAERFEPPRRADDEEGFTDPRTWRRQAGEAIEEVGGWATELGRSLR